MSSDSKCSLDFMSPMENNSNQGLFMKSGKERWTENIYTLHTRECTKRRGRDKKLHLILGLVCNISNELPFVPISFSYLSGGLR